MSATLLVLLLTSRIPLTGGWSGSFPQETVASWFPDEVNGILVASAGGSPEAAVIADLVATGLRETARSPLVMDASALGDIAHLDDFAIARRTAAYPIQVVVVVRVFPGAEGEPPRALVTVLTHGGAVLAAYGTARGTPLAAASPRVDASRTDPEAEYERKVVWFRSGSLVDTKTGEVQSNYAQAFRGQSPHVLSEVELFKSIDRADLADAYQVRAASRVLLGLGGAAALITGVVFGIAAITNPCIGMAQGTTAACPAHDGIPEAMLGLGFGLVGVAGMVLAQTFEAMPVDDGTLRELVEAYNHALRTRLLPKAPPAASAAGALNVVPVVFPGGAGVVLRSTL